ncbi:MAG: dihydrolipoyl dehydrogenase [Candidatus Eisenbacteria bacterium]|nr:dihydrolipoyl dehydrogenase [Candidatus Eisenbacteria bacterium]
MAERKDFDVVILGGGPGGYVAAIRAAQLGFKTAVVEKERLGGVCLNWGCIPSKALLKNSEVYRSASKAAEWGITIEGLSFDFKKVIDKSRTVSDTIVKGVEFLMKKNKIEVISGTGKFVAKGELEVEATGGVKTTVGGKHILIATGGRPRPLPFAPFDGKLILSSRHALDRREFPGSILIIGAGAIGVEFASFYNAFGSKVTLVEMLPTIVPVEDKEIGAILKKSFEKRGMAIHIGAKVNSLAASGKRIQAEIESGGTKQLVDAECALVAIGIMPNSEEMGLDKVGVTLEKGFIKVDRKTFATNIPGIYAIGDVNGPPLLAHVASAEGIVCVEQIAGHKASRVDYDNIPGCTYCQPQIGSVGLTEEQCQEQKLDYKVGKFPYSALGKAKAVGETEGMVKLIFGKKYGELLGGHIIGPEATEQVAELNVLKGAEGTQVELHRTIHAHPTFSEAVMEAAAAADGEAIHI